jgi:purine-nucleoside phosphorylase
VYAGLTGPSYETKAEVEYLARIGADAVGMSTVLETIALCDAHVRVLAFSCITNAAAGIAGAILNHAHVQAVAHLGAERMEKLILGLIPRAFGA